MRWNFLAGRSTLRQPVFRYRPKTSNYPGSAPGRPHRENFGAHRSVSNDAVLLRNDSSVVQACWRELEREILRTHSARCACIGRHLYGRGRDRQPSASPEHHWTNRVTSLRDLPPIQFRNGPQRQSPLSDLAMPRGGLSVTLPSILSRSEFVRAVACVHMGGVSGGSWRGALGIA